MIVSDVAAVGFVVLAVAQVTGRMPAWVDAHPRLRDGLVIALVVLMIVGGGESDPTGALYDGVGPR